MKKNLLFITPVLPSTKGRGRNLRAYRWVYKLSRTYNVSVLCTSIYGDYQFHDAEHLAPLDCRVFEWRHSHSLLGRIKNLFLLRPNRWNAKGSEWKEKLQALNLPEPDVILCFRLHNVPVAFQAKEIWSKSRMWMDLDEIDSRTKSSISKLMSSKKFYVEAAIGWLDVLLFSYRESCSLHQFDRIFASTKTEKTIIEKLYSLKNVRIFENMLQAEDASGVISTPEPGEPFQFLFVGDSSYFPNLDAIDEILFKIVPRLQETASKPFRFVIIGGKAGRKQMRQIQKYPCIQYYYDVKDLKTVYSRSNAVVVPLRAGGGSSLKFLEALRYRKPVVSSTVGARGFDVKNGSHALIGKDAEEIAGHCRNLMENTNLAARLSKKGHQWFLANNAFDVTPKLEHVAV